MSSNNPLNNLLPFRFERSDAVIPNTDDVLGLSAKDPLDAQTPPSTPTNGSASQPLMRPSPSSAAQSLERHQRKASRHYSSVAIPASIQSTRASPEKSLAPYNKEQLKNLDEYARRIYEKPPEELREKIAKVGIKFATGAVAIAAFMSMGIYGANFFVSNKDQIDKAQTQFWYWFLVGLGEVAGVGLSVKSNSTVWEAVGKNILYMLPTSASKWIAPRLAEEMDDSLDWVQFGKVSIHKQQISAWSNALTMGGFRRRDQGDLKLLSFAKVLGEGAFRVPAILLGGVATMKACYDVTHKIFGFGWSLVPFSLLSAVGTNSLFVIQKILDPAYNYILASYDKNRQVRKNMVALLDAITYELPTWALNSEAKFVRWNEHFRRFQKEQNKRLNGIRQMYENDLSFLKIVSEYNPATIKARVREEMDPEALDNRDLLLRALLDYKDMGECVLAHIKKRFCHESAKELAGRLLTDPDIINRNTKIEAYQQVFAEAEQRAKLSKLEKMMGLYAELYFNVIHDDDVNKTIYKKAWYKDPLTVILYVVAFGVGITYTAPLAMFGFGSKTFLDTLSESAPVFKFLNNNIFPFLIGGSSVATNLPINLPSAFLLADNILTLMRGFEFKAFMEAVKRCENPFETVEMFEHYDKRDAVRLALVTFFALLSGAVQASLTYQAYENKNLFEEVVPRLIAVIANFFGSSALAVLSLIKLAELILSFVDRKVVPAGDVYEHYETLPESKNSGCCGKLANCLCCFGVFSSKKSQQPTKSRFAKTLLSVMIEHIGEVKNEIAQTSYDNISNINRELRAGEWHVVNKDMLKDAKTSSLLAGGVADSSAGAQPSSSNAQVNESTSLLEDDVPLIKI